MQLVNKNPTSADLRNFGLAMLVGFGVIGALAWYVGPDPNSVRWYGVPGQKWAIAAWAVGFALLGVAHGPRAVARSVYIVWMTVATVMGSVLAVLWLTVLFVVVLPWFALIRFKDPLRMRLRPPGESYWEDHPHHESTLERMLRPF